MSLLNKLQGNLSITFILDIAIPGLKEIFKHEGFKEVSISPQPVQAAPGIIFGPPRVPIAVFDNTRITYFPERYRLDFQGPINEILKLKELVTSLFEKHNYALSDMTRYTEFSMQPQPIECNELIDKIRSSITVKNIEGLNEICECQMKPFSVSLSNMDTALSDEWFHITLRPDVNRPHEIMLVQIVKRTPKFEEMNIYLNKLEGILSEIRNMLSA